MLVMDQEYINKLKFIGFPRLSETILTRVSGSLVGMQKASEVSIEHTTVGGWNVISFFLETHQLWNRLIKVTQLQHCKQS